MFLKLTRSLKTPSYLWADSQRGAAELCIQVIDNERKLRCLIVLVETNKSEKILQYWKSKAKLGKNARFSPLFWILTFSLLVGYRY